MQRHYSPPKIANRDWAEKTVNLTGHAFLRSKRPAVLSHASHNLESARALFLPQEASAPTLTSLGPKQRKRISTRAKQIQHKAVHPPRNPESTSQMGCEDAQCRADRQEGPGTEERSGNGISGLP